MCYHDDDRRRYEHDQAQRYHIEEVRVGVKQSASQCCATPRRNVANITDSRQFAAASAQGLLGVPAFSNGPRKAAMAAMDQQLEHPMRWQFCALVCGWKKNRPARRRHGSAGAMGLCNFSGTGGIERTDLGRLGGAWRCLVLGLGLTEIVMAHLWNHQY